MPEIAAVQSPHWLPARHGELENRHAATWTANADHFPQSDIRVRDISQTEGDGDNLELIVVERQSLRIGLLKSEVAVNSGSLFFLFTDRQHLLTEIRSNDADFPFRATIVGQCQIASPGADIQDGAIPGGGNNAHRPPTPVAIHVQRQQMIHQVVAWSDLSEHLLNSLIAFVDWHLFLRRGFDGERKKGKNWCD
jgi:hypothetical protein